MTWAGIVLLALGSFLIGVLLLRHARQVWTLFAATLVFGLAGYAWQGSPGTSSSPRSASADTRQPNPQLIDARREFFDISRPPSRFVLTGDTYARRGDYQTAAGFYRNAVAENPNDGEGWLALGVALIEYANGRASPGAVLAFQNARDRLPGNPAPAYFAGLSEIRAGNLPEARELWADALASASPNATGRPYLEERLSSLDELLQVIAAGTGR